ncbi:MAG: hypothetical protein HY057_07530 [Rhodospirillales bacterium]|nr:hypothetical protein [Rhodospirillales bacterium]
MKISINIDCSPDEARAFLGLPDVRPMQDALMKQLSQRMEQALHAMDPETMLKTWFPASVQGWDQMQKMFWNQMAAGMGGGPHKDAGKK